MKSRGRTLLRIPLDGSPPLASGVVEIQPLNSADASFEFDYLDGDDTAGRMDDGAITNGQALIESLSGEAKATQLADWLGATFPNMYSVDPEMIPVKSN
ncbi:MAG: hypothetical protein R6U98_33100 [Pirellulaceae bacterium]